MNRQNAKNAKRGMDELLPSGRSAKNAKHYCYDDPYTDRVAVHRYKHGYTNGLASGIRVSVTEPRHHFLCPFLATTRTADQRKGAFAGEV